MILSCLSVPVCERDIRNAKGACKVIRFQGKSSDRACCSDDQNSPDMHRYYLFKTHTTQTGPCFAQDESL